ncbi:hypothetical protein GCM10008927_13250 [Amylibacter ulvae]|uniref:Carrier domain-containing protein n=1 Tax=Paramylibacter ulvae TaxID=1651968 RepID=A0ABQ3CY50_9RHOB|nr:acyl carrier protein [Amylibacter ulvae]GHA49395.1 hypothetical protein GCM10008927_13250 [Amylibacter ulvae]
MNEKEAVQIIKDALEQILGADPGELTMDMNLVELELLDSLDIAEFVADIDTRLGRKFVPDDEVDYDLFIMSNLVAKIAA